MACRFCDIIAKKQGKVYEDDATIAVLSPTPSAPGHLILLPKEHKPILEQISDEVTGHMFTVANRLSVAAFEGLGAQGTNIFVQNGVAAGQQHAHVMMHIIPRRENDGIDLTWKPKQLSEEEMSTVELKLKEATKGETKAEPEEKAKPEEAEDYLLKQLERLP